MSVTVGHRTFNEAGPPVGQTRAVAGPAEPESESLAGLDDASSVTLNTVSVSGSELEVSPADAERIQVRSLLRL